MKPFDLSITAGNYAQFLGVLAGFEAAILILWLTLPKEEKVHSKFVYETALTIFLIGFFISLLTTFLYCEVSGYLYQFQSKYYFFILASLNFFLTAIFLFYGLSMAIKALNLSSIFNAGFFTFSTVMIIGICNLFFSFKRLVGDKIFSPFFIPILIILLVYFLFRRVFSLKFLHEIFIFSSLIFSSGITLYSGFKASKTNFSDNLNFSSFELWVIFLFIELIIFLSWITLLIKEEKR